MNRRSSLSFVALSAALFACSSAEPGDEGTLDADESEVRACDETYAKTWIVTLEGRSCGDVEGARGRWVAAPLEPEASDSVCTMTWQGASRARADMDALRAFVRAGVDVMAPSCSSAALDVGALTPIPHLEMLSLAGANGCDVCGKLRRNRSILVVLPPYETSLRQFEVPLTDGTMRAFQIEASPVARAVSVTLPPPPAGTEYAATRVTIY